MLSGTGLPLGTNPPGGDKPLPYENRNPIGG